MELRDSYIDPVTHQTVSLDEILVEYERTKVHDVNFHWFKFFVPEFVRLLETFSSPKLSAFSYIIKNMSHKTNLFEKSYADIMEATHTSSATVASLMVLLQKGDFLRNKGVSCWMVNPALMYAGGDAKGRTLACIYDKLPLPNTRKAVKKKFDEDSSTLADSVANGLAARLKELIAKGGGDEDVDDI